PRPRGRPRSRNEVPWRRLVFGPGRAGKTIVAEAVPGLRVPLAGSCRALTLAVGAGYTFPSGRPGRSRLPSFSRTEPGPCGWRDPGSRSRAGPRPVTTHQRAARPEQKTDTM